MFQNFYLKKKTVTLRNILQHNKKFLPRYIREIKFKRYQNTNFQGKKENHKEKNLQNFNSSILHNLFRKHFLFAHIILINQNFFQTFTANIQIKSLW